MIGRRVREIQLEGPKSWWFRFDDHGAIRADTFWRVIAAGRIHVTSEDHELSVRIARLCVLFEDLRIEYYGSRTDEELPLDALSRMYRRFYFLRRSLVTLDEFGGALNRLNAIR